MRWCPVCNCEVPGEHVTFEECHDPRSGGCGSKVGDKPDSEQIKILSIAEGKKFESEVNALLAEGYVISSTSCGFINSESYDFMEVWQAILVKR